MGVAAIPVVGVCVGANTKEWPKWMERDDEIFSRGLSFISGLQIWLQLLVAGSCCQVFKSRVKRSEDN